MMALLDPLGYRWPQLPVPVADPAQVTPVTPFGVVIKSRSFQVEIL